MVAKNDAIDPDLIELDKENPRILHLMETTQMEDISAELIHLALKGTASGFKQLTTAIKLNKGIINPIIVNKKNGKMVAMDGNTRLLIYQEFKKENPQTDQGGHGRPRR